MLTNDLTPSTYLPDNKQAEESTKPLVKITKSTKVSSSDNTIRESQEWFSVLEDGVTIQVHCPISPEKHSNNDANASCMMHKNGAYLNFHCFACNGKESLKLGDVYIKRGTVAYEYSVAVIDKDALLMKLKKGLTSISHITDEMVRLLPELEKKEKKND